MSTIYIATNRRNGHQETWDQNAYDAMKKQGWTGRFYIEKREIPDGPTASFEPPELKTDVHTLVKDIAQGPSHAGKEST